MTRWGIVLTLVMVAAPLQAAQWVDLKTKSPDQYAYDKSKLFISGDDITYWKRVIFTVPRYFNGRYIGSGLYRERIDCKEHTLKLISYMFYAPDGSVADYAPAHEAESSPIIPETVGDAFEKTMCPLVAAHREEEARKAAVTTAPDTTTTSPAGSGPDARAPAPAPPATSAPTPSTPTTPPPAASAAVPTPQPPPATPQPAPPPAPTSQSSTVPATERAPSTRRPPPRSVTPGRQVTPPVAPDVTQPRVHQPGAAPPPSTPDLPSMPVPPRETGLVPPDLR